MALILSCFVFVVLTSTSAYNRYFYEYTELFNSQGNRPDIHLQNYRHYVPKYLDEMNERSIVINSGVQRVQRVQELEKKRLLTRVKETHPRVEKGSSKIINTSMKPRPYPVIANRIGGSEDSPYTFNISQECRKLGYCQKINNYPYDVVNSIIAELSEKIKKNRFNVDVLEKPEISHRQGPGQKNIQLCDVTETLLVPQAAQTESGEWHVILNQKDVPLQGYRAEICRFMVDSSSTNKCDNIVKFSNKFTARCKQLYTYRAMAAVDVDKREIIYDKLFKVPSCCSCVATNKNSQKYTTDTTY